MLPRVECSYTEMRESAIPGQLGGKTVLDLGGYCGGSAKLALARGAARAVCVDNGEWQRYGWAPPERFEGVEYLDGSFEDFSTPADLVIFYNVLYHCRDPWGALLKLRTLTGETLAIVTSILPGDEPRWGYCEPEAMAPRDGTVYWKPALAALLVLLAKTGFRAEGIWTQSGGDHVAIRCA